MRRSNSIYALLAGVVVVLTCIAPVASAQRVAAVTTSMSALREAAGVYMQVVDFAQGGVLPGVVKLSGRSPTAPLRADPAGKHLLLGTGTHRGEASRPEDRAWYGLATAAPLALPPLWHAVEAPGTRGWPLGMTSESAVFARTGADGNSSLAFAPLPNSEAARWPAAPQFLPLPGTPAAGVLWGDHTAAVLCADSTGIQLVLVDTETQRITQTVTLTRPLGASDLRPAALAVSPEGTLLWAMVRGFSLDAQQGDAESWLYAFRADELTPVAEPLRLRGAPRDTTGALHPLGGGRCWTALRTPGTDFARAALVQADAVQGTLARVTEASLAGVAETFVLAPAPDRDLLAVAMDRRLELWPGGTRGATALEFDAPINVLRWAPEGLLVGEAGRIHLVDSAEPPRIISSVQLQSGWVSGLHVYDRAAPQLPGNNALRRPMLNVPGEVVFEGEAAGRELRALRIAPATDRASWRIDFDREAMPWLVLQPASGTGPAHVYMGVNPDYYAPGTTPAGQLEIAVDSAPAAVVDLRVLPGRLSSRSILWACGEDAGFDRLRSHLSAPPRLFSHTTAGAAYAEALDSFAIVVLDVSAAAAGVLARPVVMDYVRRGGALLYVGQHTPTPPARDTGRFLGPIGIYLDTTAKEAGLFGATSTELGKYWERFPISDGARIYAEAPYRAVPDGRGGEGAILAARTYGHGRLAVIAGPAPLGTDGMRNGPNKRFASRLFAWLAAAKTEFRDFDGDGLPDEIEDSKPADAGGAPNAVDPGETDYLFDDTDHDGIPDGMEDSNLNGRVDDGETDPRSADSDGDGIFDGADETPAPAAGAPRITHVDPAQGPADGGIWVTIGGANFVPGSSYWFGENRARALRGPSADLVEVRLPDAGAIESGPVPVRVQHPPGGPEIVLPDAFTYTPRREAKLSFLEASKPLLRGQSMEGELAITLDAPPGVDLRSCRFQIVYRARYPLEWPGYLGATRTLPNGVEITVRETAKATIEIVCHALHSEHLENGPVAVLPFVTRESEIRFVFLPDTARVMTTEGSLLDVAFGTALDVNTNNAAGP